MIIKKRTLIQGKSLHHFGIIYIQFNYDILIINNPHKIPNSSYRTLGRSLSGGDLDVAGLLGAVDLLVIGEIAVHGGAVVVTGGEDGPDEVHGSGGESAASKAEEEGKRDAEDVLGAVTEGGEVVVRSGGEP